MAKSSSKKSSGRRATRRAPKASAGKARGASAPARTLASIPVEELAAELKRRRSEIPKLEARAKSLRAELGAIESRIALLSGAVPAARAQPVRTAPKRAASSGGRSGRRMNGKPTLAERILAQLRGHAGPMSPRAIAEGLSKELGREVNQSFLVHVSITLRKLVNNGLVAQPARAQYVAKDAAGEPKQ